MGSGENWPMAIRLSYFVFTQSAEEECVVTFVVLRVLIEIVIAFLLSYPKHIEIYLLMFTLHTFSQVSSPPCRTMPFASSHRSWQSFTTVPLVYPLPFESEQDYWYSPGQSDGRFRDILVNTRHIKYSMWSVNSVKRASSSIQANTCSMILLSSHMASSKILAVMAAAVLYADTPRGSSLQAFPFGGSYQRRCFTVPVPGSTLRSFFSDLPVARPIVSRIEKLLPFINKTNLHTPPGEVRSISLGTPKAITDGA
ncbi:hypothetical protein J6590_069675 [Homalodisca vitripennis]|nr:hypothetical protein J6590_069675 [Homalodisca vitripennis]